MKRQFLIFLVCALMIGALYCDKDNSTEPTGSKSTDLGKGILINVSPLYPEGMSTLYINSGDTIAIHMASVLLNDPQYSFEPADAAMLKVDPDAKVDTTAWVIALGDSGTSTTLKIIDNANDASKTIPVEIVKQWADPQLYELIGQFEGHTYYLSKDKKTWTEAEIICREIGGYLATINSGAENNLLDEGRGQIDDLWIGIKMNKVGDKWKVTDWANGEELTYENFNGKPNSPGIFWEIYFHMDENGKWESWHEQPLYYFLEME